MATFINLRKSYEKIKILILGSYIPKNFEILNALKTKLIEKGFRNTFIANDLVKVPEEGIYREKMAVVLLAIKEEMFESDFNIFVFFSNQENNLKIFNK